jgi:hypothetical protein
VFYSFIILFILCWLWLVLVYHVSYLLQRILYCAGDTGDSRKREDVCSRELNLLSIHGSHNTNDPFHNINQQSENNIIYNEDRITSAIVQDSNPIVSIPVENIIHILMDHVCMMQHSLHNNTDVNYCKWMNEREMNPLSNNAGNFYRINNATCDNSVFIFLMLRQLPVAPSLTILQYLQFRISNVSRL